MTDHDPRAVEALGREAHRAFDAAMFNHDFASCWDGVGRPMVDREAALEADAERLVAALEDVETNARAFELSYTVPRNTLRRVQRTLAAHRASRQPGEPTLNVDPTLLAEGKRYIVGFDPADPQDGDGACALILDKAALTVEASIRGNLTFAEAQAMTVALARERERGK